jgi:OOP family OmpA-OmpF porin
MQRPNKWWIGLPFLAAIAYFASDSITRKIEIDLATRAAEQLAQLPDAIDNAKVVAAGRDVAVSGVALSPEGRDQALLDIRRIDGLRAALDETKVIGTAKPFVLRLERKGGLISLEGDMPVRSERDKLHAELFRLGFEISDRSNYAREAPPVFVDLALFAARKLAEMDPGAATLTDDALSLEGEAKLDADLDKLIASAKSAPAGARVDHVSVTPPRVSPYAWSATRKGEMISLEGFVPTSEARTQILTGAAKAAAGAAVSDATHIGSGAPEGDFIGAVGVALAQLAKLTAGKVSLKDSGLTVQGEGKANVTALALDAEIKANLPKGFSLSNLDLAEGPPSPFVFSATLKDASVFLSGHVPDAAALEDIHNLVHSRFAGAVLSESLAQAKGAPKGFTQAIAAALPSLGRLASGKLTLADRSVTLSGEAPFEGAVADIHNRLATARPQGFVPTAQLSPRTLGMPMTAAEGQKAVNELLARAPLAFDERQPTLRDAEMATLDALAQILLRVADANFDVIGHLPGPGIEEVNREIGKRRAQAVIDRLVELGVGAGRLTAVGVAQEGVGGSAIQVVAQ